MTAGSLFAVFCVWSESDPFFVLGRYAEILAMHHTGDAILAGISEFRPLICSVGCRHVRSGRDCRVDRVLACCRASASSAFRKGRHTSECCMRRRRWSRCWSLMTFYHLTYGFVILLPVMMLLALNDTEPSRLRRTLFWLLQLGMMFDIPGLSRRAGLAETALLHERPRRTPIARSWWRCSSASLFSRGASR